MLMKKIHVFFTVMVLLALSLSAAAQNVTVKGTVKDAAGEGIVGANIILKGNRTVYTMTDISGAFSLNVPANGVLEVLCMGFVGQDVPVSGRTNIDIVLQDDSQLLDETIVVAYGTATKSSFTGSASVVDNETIEKKIATSVTSALAGTTPGVQITSSSGDPAGGGGNTIRVRGIGSMSASNSPLIVVDGVPYDGSISDINPQDVESMSVLKDAAASAIYGHRGANGVVIITTKKGQSGDAQVKFDARFGVNSRLIPQYDVITDPGLYYETFFQRLYNQYKYAGHTVAESYAYANKYLLDEQNGGLGYLVYTVPEGQNLIGTNFKLNPNAKLGYSDGEYYYIPDDWYKEAFHNAYRQEYNVSASGGANRFNYYASVGYLQNTGIVNNSDYKRYTGRINAEYQAKSWMRFITSMNYSHTYSQQADWSDSYGSSGNLFYIANSIGPIYPLYVRKVDEQGNPYLYKEGGRQIYDSNNTNQKRPSIVGNAIRDNEYDNTYQYADVLTGKFGTILTPLPGLALTANVGFTSDNTRYSSLSSQFAGSASTDGYVYVSHSRMWTVNQQYLAEYKIDFAGVNNLDVLAGYENYSLMSQGLSGSNYHLFNPFVGELSNAKGTGSMVSASSSTNRYATQGFLSRLQYDYDGRIFASASYRRDSSSRFAEGHRWGNFGSAGAAWLMSKESWFNVPFVDMLKLKVSYGVQGNDNIGGYYPYSDQYSTSWNETDGYSDKKTYVGNENLTWETSKSFNIGVDFETFNNYLNGSVEWFSRKTEDLLYNKNVPQSAGNPVGTIPVNVGSILNRGIEVSLDGAFLRRRNINWTWNLNLSHYINKVLELDESVSEDGIRSGNRIIKVGGSIYEAYMYKYAGVDPETGEAQFYGEFLKEDGSYVSRPTQKQIDDDLLETKVVKKFSQASQYDLGTVLPDLFGGFGTSLNAYGFDLSAQFSFQLGGKYYDGTYQSLMWTQDQTGNAWHKDILKAWTPENKNTDIPRNDGDVQVAQSALDRFLISASYLSVNNVTLGYTLPSAWVKKIGLSNFRIYVAGDNLAVLTARKGIDPRFSMGLGSMTSGTGLNSGYYSAMRNVTAGVTITF